MASLRALIVDDEPLAAERLAHLCARMDGVEVVGVAGDGRAALSRTEDLRPDLLLLDISMPGLDGMALGRRLASREAGPAIVFVTAHGRFAVEAFDLAATDYLLKPVSQARLEQALARVAAARPPVPAPLGSFLSEIWAPRGREMNRAFGSRISAHRIGTTGRPLRRHTVVAEAISSSRVPPPYQCSTWRGCQTVPASVATLASVARRWPALRGLPMVPGARDGAGS